MTENSVFPMLLQFFLSCLRISRSGVRIPSGVPAQKSRKALIFQWFPGLFISSFSNRAHPKIGVIGCFSGGKSGGKLFHGLCQFFE
uniref:Actin cytoskeleton-regulatory complex protein n=1 Tax=Myoviridae sp. ctr0w28 TaxID=2826703 RepID=A0A8S5NQM6_9CAUD|nr:MAG TPA: actin cytoskeleton-regulatory complex protein [Myoviridae sp. ctr0w28]